MRIIMALMAASFLISCSKSSSEGHAEQAQNTTLSSPSGQPAPLSNPKDKHMVVPYSFRVKISLEDIATSVTINDIQILANFDGSRIDATLPVTSRILSGRNSMGAKVFTDHPSYGVQPRFQVILEAQPFDESKDWFEISRIEFTGKLTPGLDVAGVKKTELSEFRELSVRFDPRTELGRVRQYFDLKADMPDWAWSKSVALTRKSPELELLRETYLDYYKLFEDLNPESGRRASALAEIRHRLDEMLTELGQVYDISADDAFYNLGIEDTTQDSDYTLMPLGNPKKWKPAVSADGRLMELYPNDRDDILMYEFEGGGLYTSFPWKFRYDGKKWIPSR